MLKSACACIVGWHYNLHVYERVNQIDSLDVYVISHRQPTDVPESIGRYILKENLFFEPNLGYDWGAYQQFLEKGVYQQYRYVFFMHDDLEILDLNFMQACITILNSCSQIVGNGRHENITNWPKLEPWSYAHSVWKPPSLEFCHECVRGSFIATTSRTLDKIGNFEVFWDRMHISDVFGNWSTKATCGKFREILGERCFGFLSENPRRSKFIIESIRGKSHGQNLN